MSEELNLQKVSSPTPEQLGPWLSKKPLAERLSAEVMDLSPRSVERLEIDSKLVQGRRRYSWVLAKAYLLEQIAQAETVIGTPGAPPLKCYKND